MKKVAMIAALALCGLLILPGAAGATDIPVTTTSDVSADDDLCSLREAIQAAQTNSAIGPTNSIDCPAGQSADDTVQLGAGTYTMSGAAQENGNVSGDFDLVFSGATQGFLVIDGVVDTNGVPQTVIDAADQDRIFDVQAGGPADTAALRIQQVTLRHGKPPEANADGGAILIRDDDAQFELNTARLEDSDAKRWGGGMANQSGTTGLDVRLNQVEFSGNTAIDDGGALWADGPQDIGTYVIRRSALVNNHTDQMGGAIYIRQTGDTNDGPVVELYNSTLSGNSATVAGGAVAFAFGLGGTLFTEFTTIADNSTAAAGQGGGIDTTAGIDEFIQGSGLVLSGNTAAGAPANCDDPSEFGGGAGSVESGPTRCFPSSTIANPLLAPLSYSGTGSQTTRTHGLFDGSPALNVLPSPDCGLGTEAQAVDQRGVARPAGGSCDAGAFEGSVGPAPTPPAGGGGSPPASAPTTTKKCKKKKKKRSAEVAKKKKCKKKKKGR